MPSRRAALLRVLPRAPLRRPALLLALLALLPALLSGSADRGFLIRVDHERFTLRATDLASGADGPSFQVSLGSQEHPTPRGLFALRRVVRNPRFTPGPALRARGQRAHPPSSDGPLGVAKIPFGPPSIAVHGGAHPLALGTPATLGCVGARDADLLDLLAFLDRGRALASPELRADGERHQALRRPVHLVVE
jgi:hypothetical protein